MTMRLERAVAVRRSKMAGHPTMVRWATLVLAAGLLATLLASPASALTVLRTWRATSGAASVTATLQGFTSGTGSVHTVVNGLQPATVYGVVIYKGTCSAPYVLAKLPALTTSATGAAERTASLNLAQMNTLWGITRKGGTFAIRVGTGTLARCGVFRFPVSTRVVIPSMSIDLPVIRQNSTGFPPCNVAMYIKELYQPREPGVTFIYSHARKGMFLPLLTASKINNGASMIGMKILVYTGDSYVHTYQVFKIRRHITSLDGVFGVTSEQLWLQTSEGVRGTIEKLLVIAKRVKTEQTDYASAHPTPHPVVCY